MIIANTQGSRPSLLIKNGLPFTKGTAFPDWEDVLANAVNLAQAIACTGRINYGKHAAGTGFLIAPNLIMTNRHVLQKVARERNGNWIIYSNVTIDFGFEHEGHGSYLPRLFKKVVYSGSENPRTDHTKDDIALIEIEGETDRSLQQPVPINLTENLQPGTKICVIGYPAPPEKESPETLQLFNNIYNVKRISPGMVITDSNPEYKGRMCHDASTLTGSSGSLIVALGNENAAAAIHYGGLDNVNWSHSLSHFCKPDAAPCLTTYFDAYGVKYL